MRAKCEGLTAAILLIYCAGSWSYLFYRVLLQGVCSFEESWHAWLVAEFVMALAFALYGIYFLVRRMREGK